MFKSGGDARLRLPRSLEYQRHRNVIPAGGSLAECKAVGLLDIEGAIDMEGLDVEASVDSRRGGVVDAAGGAQGALSGVVADAQEEVEVVQMTGNASLVAGS